MACMSARGDTMENDDRVMDCWQELANALITRAAEDYRADLRRIRKDPGNREAARDALKIERFFRSLWYARLTDVPGEYLIERLRKEMVG